MEAYACVHDAAAAAEKLGASVRESTVTSNKSPYKDELRMDTGSAVIMSLPEESNGQTLLLGDGLDKTLQLYI